MRKIMSVPCPMCGKHSIVTPNIQDLRDWENGKSAQYAFPYLSRAKRETLVSGLCKDCQSVIFGEED